MRISDKKNKLEKVFRDNGIFVDYEQIYSGQGQRVKNYGNIMDFLYSVSDNSWSQITKKELDDFTEKVNISDYADMQTQDFNLLMSFVNRLQSSVAIYNNILSDLAEVDTPESISIKIPKNIDTIVKLSEFNKDLYSKVFKKFDFVKSGQIKFVGFDKGSDWYVLEVAKEIYPHFVVALNTAIYIKEGLEIYFESKEFLSCFLTAKKYKPELKKEEYKKDYIDSVIQERINSVESQINNSRLETENIAAIMQATKGIIEVLEDGSEFHLSYNPPEYLKGELGSLKIDYKNTSFIENKEEVKKLEAGL